MNWKVKYMGKVVDGGLNMYKGFYEEFLCEKLYKYYKVLSWIFSCQFIVVCVYYFMIIFVVLVVFIYIEVCRIRKSCFIVDNL